MKTYDAGYFLSTVFRLRRLKRSCLNLTRFLTEDFSAHTVAVGFDRESAAAAGLVDRRHRQ